jgi:hypothetical protein
VVVSRASPAISTNASGPAAVGQHFSDTATLSAGVGATGSITFNVYGPNDATCANPVAFTSTATVSGNGDYTSGQFTPTAPGTYRFVASYGGDANNNGASSSCVDANESVVISKASPTISTHASTGVPLGGHVTDTATIAAGQGPTGQIVFKLYGAGDATCSSPAVFTSTPVTVAGNGDYTSSPQFTPATVGTYRWVATYAGDSNNAAATTHCGDTNESVVVGQVTAGTTLSSSLNPSIHGQAVTFTATVTGKNPTGTVTFKDGPSAIGTGALDAAGKATFTTSSLAVGSHTITAVYPGDASNSASTSNPVTQVVNAPGVPTISITKPAALAKYKQGRVVHADYSCADAPNGPGIKSCKGTVPNGSPISTSTPGKHTFTVTAVSTDGQTASKTVSYKVVVHVGHHGNEFTVNNITTHADGTVTFDLKLPGPGKVDVLETAWLDNFAAATAGAARLLPPAPRRFVYSRVHIQRQHGGSFSVTVMPNPKGAALVASHRYRVTLRLWISYTPVGGTQRDKGFYGLHIPATGQLSYTKPPRVDRP